jgi:hypothetical protein
LFRRKRTAGADLANESPVDLVLLTEHASEEWLDTLSDSPPSIRSFLLSSHRARISFSLHFGSGAGALLEKPMDIPTLANDGKLLLNPLINAWRDWLAKIQNP